VAKLKLARGCEHARLRRTHFGADQGIAPPVHVEVGASVQLFKRAAS
jgi:hypothetical protein